MQGHLEIAKLLIKNSATNSITNNDGKKPSDLARDNDNTALADLLEDA